jgi:hypothetical protein
MENLELKNIDLENLDLAQLQELQRQVDLEYLKQRCLLKGNGVLRGAVACATSFGYDEGRRTLLNFFTSMRDIEGAPVDVVDDGETILKVFEYTIVYSKDKKEFQYF